MLFYLLPQSPCWSFCVLSIRAYEKTQPEHPSRKVTAQKHWFGRFLAKKRKKNLVMSKKNSNFAPAFVKSIYGVRGRVV